MKPKRLPELYENDITRFWSKVVQREFDECWPWTDYNGMEGGRGRFVVTLKGAERHLIAPRIAYFLHYGRDPFPEDVLHNAECNNPNCVNPYHLHLGNAVDNRAECVASGRQTKGSSHHAARLTEDIVYVIKLALIRGVMLRELATHYGVCIATIGNINTGKRWKHVKVPGFKPSNTRSKQ